MEQVLVQQLDMTNAMLAKMDISEKLQIKPVKLVLQTVRPVLQLENVKLNAFPDLLRNLTEVDVTHVLLIVQFAQQLENVKHLVNQDL